MSLHDTILAHAAATARNRRLGPVAPLFLTLWTRPGHGAAVQVEIAYSLDEAALAAAAPARLAYGGTVLLAPHQPPLVLDLTGHGAALAAEQAGDARDESRHHRSLSRGAGRPVL